MVPNWQVGETEIALIFLFPPWRNYSAPGFIFHCIEEMFVHSFLFKSQKRCSCHSEWKEGLSLPLLRLFKGNGVGLGGSQAGQGGWDPLWQLYKTPNPDFGKGTETGLLSSHEMFLLWKRVMSCLVSGLHWRPCTFPDIVLEEGRSWGSQWSVNSWRRQKSQGRNAPDACSPQEIPEEGESLKGCGCTYEADGASEPW